MHESEKWKWSRSFVSDSSRPHRLQPTRLLHPWDFPGKSTGVGCHCLIHVFTCYVFTCYVFTITSLKKNELYLLLSNPYFLIVFKNIYIYFKIWLYWVLIVAHRIFRCSMWTLSCSFQTLSFSMCDLVPWPGIEPRPPALEALSFSHWTIILVPNPYCFFFFFFFFNCTERISSTTLGRSGNSRYLFLVSIKKNHVYNFIKLLCLLKVFNR